MSKSRLVVELPKETKHEFKIYAALQGMTMSEIIELYILEILTQSEKEK